MASQQIQKESSQRLLNLSRPLVFCPACSHEKVVKSLEVSFENLGLTNNEITMVSDIGCSGLFDTFFNTHAFHGLHGRVLTYAAGIKLAQPKQTVVATMGDGGVGIGGAHLMAACRRNLDMTLLILNNFNFGMTGGQYSFTTPTDAEVGSSFLNNIEPPLRVAETLAAAGAPYVVRCSTYEKDLAETMQKAIEYPGFAVVEIMGICPGRYTSKNKISPKTIGDHLETLTVFDGEVEGNRRPEYGQAYREAAAKRPTPNPSGGIEVGFEPIFEDRKDVLILGAAGQRVNTAGDILGLAGMSAGLNVTQKSEYDITVLRGPSIAELILSPEPIDYTGLETPDVVLVFAEEGVQRRKALIPALGKETLLLCAEGVELPETGATVRKIDLKGLGIKKADFALAMLTVLATYGRTISVEMLQNAVNSRFRGKALEGSQKVIETILAAAPFGG